MKLKINCKSGIREVEAKSVFLIPELPGVTLFVNWPTDDECIISEYSTGYGMVFGTSFKECLEKLKNIISVRGSIYILTSISQAQKKSGIINT